MPRIMALLALAAAAFWQGQPALALSAAARYLADQEIAAACDGRPGSFDPAGLVERDIDGDGRDDLILSHEHIACQGGPSRSLYCGMQVCSLQFYVRRGDLLQPAGEVAGSLGPVTDNAVPFVTTYGHGGGQALWRWNGQEMAPAD